MKLILVFLFLLLTTQVCFSQSSDFYDTILNYERCRDCYFLSIDVESETYKGKVVIENDDLFKFLNKTKNFNETQYKEFMKDLLLNGKKLLLENLILVSDGTFIKIEDVSNRDFRVVNKFKNIEEISSKGCVAFIKYYFLSQPLQSIENEFSIDCKEFISKQKDELLITNRLSTTEKSAIINKLFEWQIPTRIDDYSGLLSIEPINFQCPLNTDKKRINLKKSSE